MHPNEHDTSNQHLLKVGPLSITIAQHWNNTEPMNRVCRDVTLCILRSVLRTQAANRGLWHNADITSININTIQGVEIGLHMIIMYIYESSKKVNLQIPNELTGICNLKCVHNNFGKRPWVILWFKCVYVFVTFIWELWQIYYIHFLTVNIFKVITMLTP